MTNQRDQLYRDAAGAKMARPSLQNPANAGSRVPVMNYGNGGRTDIPLQKKIPNGGQQAIQGIPYNAMPQQPQGRPAGFTGMPNMGGYTGMPNMSMFGSVMSGAMPMPGPSMGTVAGLPWIRPVQPQPQIGVQMPAVQFPRVIPTVNYPTY